MSRIGKDPIDIPKGVTIDIQGQVVKAKGPRGEMTLSYLPIVALEKGEDSITVKPANDSVAAQKMWGTTRSRLQNLVTGVSSGFKKTLEISGTGYRASMQGKVLVLQLGFSHEVRYPSPDGISISCPDQTHVVIEGSDNHLVGQTAAVICSYRPTEPYKGKGIKLEGSYVYRKEGKKK